MLRLFLLIFSIIAYSIPLKAQESPTAKGAKIIGVSGSFSSAKGELYGLINTRNNNIRISLENKIFLKDNFFVETNLNFNGNWLGNSKQIGLGVGPSLGFTLEQASKSFFPYFSAGIKYSYLKSGSNSLNGFEIPTNLGIITVVHKHIGINTFLSYQYFNLKSKRSESQGGNIFSINIGVSGLFYNKKGSGGK